MTVKVAINGFGSIGRRFLRIASKRPGIEVVAVNDLYDIETRAHLLKHDSNYGLFDMPVKAEEDALQIGDRKLRMLSERDPSALPWKDMGVDVVIESTGRFSSADDARAHLVAGAKKVIISSPAKNEDVTVVLGVNEDRYEKDKHHIISMASCTTNCLAVIAKVVEEAFGIRHGFVTTIHSYTTDQVILDFPHKDKRRARAAALSMIPTSTGVARAMQVVMPRLADRLNGIAVRVPTPAVSMVDFVVRLETRADAESVNRALSEAADKRLAGLLATTDEELVSVDYKGDPHSAIVDMRQTMSLGDELVKIVAWYDNEWAYSARLVDLVEFVHQKGL